MKKIILATLAIAMVACNNKNKVKDYVFLHGTIQNAPGDSLTIKSSVDPYYMKKIKVNADGTFQDTLQLKSPGIFFINNGIDVAYLYLKNGADIDIELDANNISETVTFTGKGSNESSFMARDLLTQKMYFNKDLSSIDTVSFYNIMQEYETAFNQLFNDYTDLDSNFVNLQKGNFNENKKLSLKENKKRQELLATSLGKGMPSPDFKDYQNNDGSKTSLSDFKGKYVYIDVWATWCGYCIAEIPYFKDLEKEYQDKNIAFVSISVDKPSDFDAWKKKVQDDELTGVQLFADQSFKSDFCTAYNITGIPRFILIDPKGNIVNAFAPAPSNDNEIKELFNNLEI